MRSRQRHSGDGVGWSRYGSIAQHQSHVVGAGRMDVTVSFEIMGACMTRGIFLSGYPGRTCTFSRLQPTTPRYSHFFREFVVVVLPRTDPGEDEMHAGITANDTASRLRNDVTAGKCNHQVCQESGYFITVETGFPDDSQTPPPPLLGATVWIDRSPSTSAKISFFPPPLGPP